MMSIRTVYRQGKVADELVEAGAAVACDVRDALPHVKNHREVTSQESPHTEAGSEQLAWLRGWYRLARETADQTHLIDFSMPQGIPPCYIRLRNIFDFRKLLCDLKLLAARTATA